MFASAVTLLSLVLSLARYPGAGPQTSASGRFVVANVDLGQKSAARGHALFLTDRRSNEKRLLLQYPRHVQAAWARDRDALAVTNEVGSTQTTVSLYVLEPSGAVRKVDVADALYGAFPSLRGELVPYLHVHLSQIRWLAGGAVEVELRAYAGNGPNVTRRYVVGLDGKARRA